MLGILDIDGSNEWHGVTNEQALAFNEIAEVLAATPTFDRR
jgi:hypothetical protein